MRSMMHPRKSRLLQRHQIRLRQGQATFDIVRELRADEHIVHASGVVDAEGRAATIARDQVGEGILHARGLRGGFQPVRRQLILMRHEHAVVMAVENGDVLKLVAPA